MHTKVIVTLPYVELITSLPHKNRSLIEAPTLSTCQLNNHPFFIPLFRCEENVNISLTISHIAETSNNMHLYKSCK